MSRIDELANELGIPALEVRTRLKWLVYSSHMKKHYPEMKPLKPGEFEPITLPPQARPLRKNNTKHGGDFNHPDFPHGTVNGYSNYACRCEKCTEANRAARARSR